MDYQEYIIGIIVNAGSARSMSMEAISEAKKNNFVEARQKIEEAGKELGKAHRIQTDLIQAEARGEKQEATLLMIHAQDHLMNAMTVKDLAEELLEVHLKFEQISQTQK